MGVHTPIGLSVRLHGATSLFSEPGAEDLLGETVQALPPIPTRLTDPTLETSPRHAGAYWGEYKP